MGTILVAENPLQTVEPPARAHVTPTTRTYHTRLLPNVLRSARPPGWAYGAVRTGSDLPRLPLLPDRYCLQSNLGLAAVHYSVFKRRYRE